MAYNITLTNGTNLVTVADGTTEQNYTSLTLIGKNFAGYGSFLNENFVKILENFANSSEPPNALQGQIWWDTTNKVLKIKNGDVWKSVSGSTSSANVPVNPTIGDLWWDSVNGQLKIWGGSSWVVVGPAYTATQGQTGIAADVIAQTGGAQSHIIVKFFVNNTCVAVLSKDPSFAVDSLAGFTTINPGFNLATGMSLAYYGDVNNALNLGGVAAANYLRSDQGDTTSGTLGITSNGGLTVGAADDYNLSVAGDAVIQTSTQSGKDMNFYVKRGGIAVKALSISGAVGGEVLLAANTSISSSSLAVASKGYVDSIIGGGGGGVLARDGSTTITGNIVPDTTNLRNFGSASAKFNTVYATTFNGSSSSATYADLAERFEADATYIPGTVVELGGAAEITASITELSENVFGVISTKAAYLMNASAGTDETHPPIAMQGRVPVRVTGKVAKGDRLVSAGNGLARAASRNEVTSFNVIGRSLQNKTTIGEGTVEAIVKLNS